MSKLKRSTWFWIVAGIVCVIIVVGFAWPQAPSGSTPTPTQPYSYVSAYDYVSGENIGDLCPFSILVNDRAIDDPNEIYDLSNYKTLVTESYPDNIKEDLSSYDYAIFITNPDEATDGYWTRDYDVYKLFGNDNFYLYGKHESTDIYGNVLDRASGTEWNGSTNGNFSTFLWFPSSTTTELHQGTDWNYDEDLDEYSANTILYLNDEANFRCQPTIFDINDDQADHERSGDYLTITETSAIKFDFNDTIGASTLGTDINFTVDCDINYLVEYGAGVDSDKLFLVFTETWNTLNGDFTFDFELTMGVNITCSNVFGGRISIPGRYFNDVAPTFTSLQTLV